MPVRLLHHVENTVHVLEWHLLVKKVAHRIDKYHSWFAPMERLLKSLWAKLQIEPVLEGMPRHPPEPFRESFCITVIAARADFRAASYRIPSRISPFNCCGACHVQPRTKEEHSTRLRRRKHLFWSNPEIP